MICHLGSVLFTKVLLFIMFANIADPFILKVFMRLLYMEQTVRSIREDFKLHGKCTILHENSVKQFKKQYQKLFDMITSPECDDGMLEHMLRLHSKVTSGELSQADGDKEMGEVAAEKYVMPLVKDKTD